MIWLQNNNGIELSPKELEAISEMRWRWVWLKELEYILGWNFKQVIQWLDSLTFKCYLAEKDIGKYRVFRIFDEKDYILKPKKL